eukprot:gene3829-2709_t
MSQEVAPQREAHHENESVPLQQEDVAIAFDTAAGNNSRPSALGSDPSDHPNIGTSSSQHSDDGTAEDVSKAAPSPPMQTNANLAAGEANDEGQLLVETGMVQQSHLPADTKEDDEGLELRLVSSCSLEEEEEEEESMDGASGATRDGLLPSFTAGTSAARLLPPQDSIAPGGGDAAMEAPRHVVQAQPRDKEVVPCAPACRVAPTPHSFSVAAEGEACAASEQPPHAQVEHGPAPARDNGHTDVAPAPTGSGWTGAPAEDSEGGEERHRLAKRSHLQEEEEEEEQIVAPYPPRGPQENTVEVPPPSPSSGVQDEAEQGGPSRPAAMSTPRQASVERRPHTEEREEDDIIHATQQQSSSSRKRARSPDEQQASLETPTPAPLSHSHDTPASEPGAPVLLSSRSVAPAAGLGKGEGEEGREPIRAPTLTASVKDEEFSAGRMPSPSPTPALPHTYTRETHVKKEERSSSSTDSDESSEESSPARRYSMLVARPKRVVTRRTAAALAAAQQAGDEAAAAALLSATTTTTRAADGSEDSGSQSRSRPPSARPAAAKAPKLASCHQPGWPPVPEPTAAETQREVQQLRRLLLAPFPAAYHPAPPSEAEMEGRARRRAQRMSLARKEREELEKRRWKSTGGGEGSRGPSTSPGRSQPPPPAVRVISEDCSLMDFLLASQAREAAANEEERSEEESYFQDLLLAEMAEEEDGEGEDVLSMLQRVCEDKMYMLGAWRRFYDARQRWRLLFAAAGGVHTRRQRSFVTLPRRTSVSKHIPTSSCLPPPPVPPTMCFSFPLSSWQWTPAPPLDVRPLLDPNAATPLFPHYPRGARGRGTHSSYAEAGGSTPDGAEKGPVPLVVTQEELASYARYVMSRGKLRNDCRDPHQFLSTRAQLFRLRLEGENVNDADMAQKGKKKVNEELLLFLCGPSIPVHIPPRGIEWMTSSFSLHTTCSAPCLSRIYIYACGPHVSPPPPPFLLDRKGNNKQSE